MSNGKGRTLAFEMEMRENFKKILQALNEMRQDFKQNLNKFETGQTEIRKEKSENINEFTECKKERVVITDSLRLKCEAIQQGFAKNYQQLKRVKSLFAEERAELFAIIAMLRETNERLILLNQRRERNQF